MNGLYRLTSDPSFVAVVIEDVVSRRETGFFYYSIDYPSVISVRFTVLIRPKNKKMQIHVQVAHPLIEGPEEDSNNALTR